MVAFTDLFPLMNLQSRQSAEFGLAETESYVSRSETCVTPLSCVYPARAIIINS